jgi:hypothetical protein
MGMRDFFKSKFNLILTLIFFLVVGIIVDAIVFKYNQNKNFEIEQQANKPEVFYTEDLKENELQGPIDFVEIIEYATVLKFGEVQKGNITNSKKIQFNPFQKILSESQMFYDTYYVGVEYEYDKKQRKILEKSYDYLIQDKKQIVAGINITKFFYDKNNKLIRKVLYNNDGIQINKTKYFYDELGRLVNEVTYTGDEYNEIELFRIEKVYLTKDSILEIEVNSGEERKWIIVYDKKGNEVKKWIINNQGKSELMYALSYNNKGKLTTSKGISLFGGKPFASQFYYNRFGNEIKSISNDGDVEIVETKYSYDDQKNWITRTTIYQDHTPVITERSIYYIDDMELSNRRLNY